MKSRYYWVKQDQTIQEISREKALKWMMANHRQVVWVNGSQLCTLNLHWLHTTAIQRMQEHYWAQELEKSANKINQS